MPFKAPPLKKRAMDKTNELAARSMGTIVEMVVYDPY